MLQIAQSDDGKNHDQRTDYLYRGKYAVVEQVVEKNSRNREKQLTDGGYNGFYPAKPVVINENRTRSCGQANDEKEYPVDRGGMIKLYITSRKQYKNQ